MPAPGEGGLLVLLLLLGQIRMEPKGHGDTPRSYVSPSLRGGSGCLSDGIVPLPRAF